MVVRRKATKKAAVKLLEDKETCRGLRARVPSIPASIASANTNETSSSKDVTALESSLLSNDTVISNGSSPNGTHLTNGKHATTGELRPQKRAPRKKAAPRKSKKPKAPETAEIPIGLLQAQQTLIDLMNQPTPPPVDPNSETGIIAKVEGAMRGLGKLESEVIAALFPPSGCSAESMEAIAERLGMTIDEVQGIADGALRGLRGSRGSANRISTVWN